MKSDRRERFALMVWTAFILTVVCTPPSFGQEDKMEAVRDMFKSDYTEEMYYRTDRLLRSATGSLKPVYRAPAVATVISAEDIEAMGATSLDEVLETVAGLHVSPSPFNRMSSVYSIRGIHTKFNPQVLMLMNDLPFPQLWSGGVQPLFRLPVSNISRVEVIRGPGSAVYGADAFAGTINIITKSAADIDGTQVGGGFGSFDTQDAWISHGQSANGWDVALNMEYQKSNGDTDRIIEKDLQSALDQIFGTDVSLAPGPLSTGYTNINGHLELAHNPWTIRLWSWLQGDSGMGSGGAQALDPIGSQSAEQFLTDISWQDDSLFQYWDLNVRGSYLYRHQDCFYRLFPPGAVVPIGSDGNINFTDPAGIVAFPDGVYGIPGGIDRQAGLDATACFHGFTSHAWRLGAGAKHYQLEPTEFKNFGPGVIDGTEYVVDGTLTDVSDTAYAYISETSRNLWYFSIQDEWRFARRWELTAGVRYDSYSDFGATINPRIALVWEPRHDLTTKLLYGRAFRPPSFAELYARNNPVTLGNINVNPETIDTYELAFDYQPTQDLHFILNLFTYEIDGLIEQVPDANATTSTAQNAVDQKGRGFEFEAQWQVTDAFSLRGNFAWQRSENKDTENLTPDAPGMQCYANALWKFLPQWSADAQVTWVGDRKRAAGDTRPEIDDYTVADLTARRKKIANHWDLALSVKNLFDADIREPASTSIPDDFPMPGRSLYAEVRYTF